jgi:hypothetical protein
LVGATIAGAPILLAQFAANRQPAVGQVNPQLNTEIYGRGTTTGSVRYTPASTSMAMNSEVRYAAWSSGATPSSIRANYGRIGPLAPGGAMDYIPAAQSYAAPVNRAPPEAMGSAAFSTGSVRYSTPRSSQANLASSAQISSALVSAGPITAGPTIRYTP